MKIMQKIILFSICTMTIQGYNRNFFPLGERESYMGNTGTAFESSTGNGLFNPAGLAAIENNKLSVTGSVYQLYNAKYNNVGFKDSTTLDYENGGFTAIPATVVTVTKKKRFAYSILVLVPNALQLQNITEINTAKTKGTYSQLVNNQDLWAGLGIGYQLTKRWSIGVTGWALKSSNLTTTNYVARDKTTANNTVFNLSTWQQTDTIGVSITTGILYNVNDVLNIGYRLQTPMFQVRGTAINSEKRQDIVAGVIDPTTEVNVSENGIAANTRVPADMTLGFSINFTDEWRVLTDISFQAGETFESMPGSVLNETIDYDPTFRYNVGTAYELAYKFHLLGGVFYNPDNTATLTGRLTGQKVNFTGGSFGLIWIENYAEIGIGGYFSRGTGKAITGPDKQTTDVTILAYGLLLSTSFQL